MEKSEEEFNYEEQWEKEEEKESERLVEQLPKGPPRKGIKGRYLHVKGHVSQRRIRESYKYG